MRPITITEPAVVVPARCAPDLAPVLVRELARARALGVQVAPETVEVVERLELLAAAVMNRVSHVSADVSHVDKGSSAAGRWLSVNATADILKITPQAVTGLLRRESLAGERVGRTWRVDAAAVAARKEVRP